MRCESRGNGRRVKRPQLPSTMTLTEFLALEAWRRSNIKRTGTAYVLDGARLITVTITDYVPAASPSTAQSTNATATLA